LYARYAERSDPAAADDAKAPADHQRTSSAPKPSDADQVAETVEEEEEVFTKE
jgi:hypothetical protein